MTKTRNDKVIVVSGVTHSGTNLVWNILQSHPKVCGASLETGQLLYWHTSRVRRHALRLLLSSPLLRGPLFSAIGRRTDGKLYRDKLHNLDQGDNRYIAEDQLYPREQVEEGILCLKSVNRDVMLNPFFDRLYPGSYFVSLLRDPLAVCDGWIRRGSTAAQAGTMYRFVAESMLRDAERFGDRHMFLQFEQVVGDPFGTAGKLFRFADLEPQVLEKLRLKIKPALTAAGEHAVSFGKAGSKYWFDRSSIREVLSTDVSHVQRSRLTPAQRAEFEHEVGPILQRLGAS